MSEFPSFLRLNNISLYVCTTFCLSIHPLMDTGWLQLNHLCFNLLSPLADSHGEGNGTPTPVLLPGESHGQRSLVGCSPWGRTESDTTERLHFHFSLSCIGEGNGTPVFLPGEPQGQGSLVGCRLWSPTESDTTEAT